MKSSTFFILFIPILAVILLLVNLLLSPHISYQEKNSAFECGFRSFLDQNRTQFNVSFFVFGLLFIIFDIEIVASFPYGTSAYSDDKVGLLTMLIFFVTLTGGLVQEIGKGALDIDSAQSLELKDSKLGVMKFFHIFIEGSVILKGNFK
jgi:NADH-ubiquinone oxidoreductase chain 3